LDYRAPQTDAELTLAAILQEVLRIERVGVDDNFFDLGASSLLLAQVHERLQERLGREIHLVEVFNHPTVRALASHLEQDGTSLPTQGRSADRSEQLRQGRDRLRRRLQQKR
jgi:acyl carrier protein